MGTAGLSVDNAYLDATHQRHVLVAVDSTEKCDKIAAPWATYHAKKIARGVFFYRGYQHMGVK